MKSINTEKLANLRVSIQITQSQVPEHSLDWNIYQGQLGILDQVEQMIEKEGVELAPEPTAQLALELEPELVIKPAKKRAKKEETDTTEE